MQGRRALKMQSKRKSASLQLTDLPSEVLSNITQHVSRKSLFKLQRLSKQFFELASAQIYSALDFRFTTPEAKDYDTPSTRFSDALQTIVTSDYDYAQHIKSFCVAVSYETLLNAWVMTKILYSSESEPSKTLNTTLLLMIKKAKAMETFQWNVPVQLNGLVYQALHRIPTLRNLEIVLDGSPINLAFAVHQANSTFPPHALQHHHPPSTLPPQTTAGDSILSVTANSANPGGSIKRALPHGNERYDYWKHPCHLSGLSGLKTLALKEITDLGCLGEIAGCLRASSANLKSLTLSLSRELALKARKPDAIPPMVEDASEADMTESEDEHPDLPAASQPAQTISAADARKDRLAQEAILTRIFSLQDVASEGRKLEKDLALSKEASIMTPPSTLLNSSAPLNSLIQSMDPAHLLQVMKAFETGEQLSVEMKDIFRGLASSSKGSLPTEALSNTAPASGSTSTPSAALCTCLSCSKSLMAGQQPAHKVGLPQGKLDLDDVGQATFNALSKAAAKKAQTSTMDQQIQSQMATSKVSSLEDLMIVPEPSLPSAVEPQTQLQTAYEDDMDIDIDHPDESTVDTGLDNEFTDDEDQEELGTDENSVDAHTSVGARKRARISNAPSPSPSAVERLTKVSSNSRSNKAKGKGKEREVTMTDVNEESQKAPKTKDESMQEYIRATHGLRIEQFTLLLIPLKASIVARALDLTVLKHITLLEVGPQAVFWQLLQRLSKSTPEISFKIIHTDDVSNGFLSFLTTMPPGLKEIYLMKRKSKDADASDSLTGPLKTDTIFKFGLRKHLKTLTHIMLRNEQDEFWDLDEKTIRILSLRCGGLVELAMSMRIETLHILTQHISQFTSLRALYFIHLRPQLGPGATDAPYRYMSFILDAMTYLPKRNLRYLAVGERYATIESPADVNKRCKSVADKMRKKAERARRAMGKNNAGVVTAIAGEEDSWDEDGWEYAALKAQEAQLRWATRFWEVPDVKIFDKAKRTGRLG